jgi:O-antigen/teichoic acid export membrane protein
LKKIINNFHLVTHSAIKKVWKNNDKSDIRSRFINGAFWSLTGSVVSQGLMIIASIIVARILGKLEYGELGMIRSTVNMFAVFAGFGLGVTATKYIAEFSVKDRDKTGKIIGLTTIFAGVIGFIISASIIIMAPFLADKTINAPHLVNEIRLGAIILFFSSLNGSFTGILAGFQAFKSIAKINLIAGVIAFPLQIGLTLLLGLPGSVIGFGLNFLVLWIFNYSIFKFI